MVCLTIMVHNPHVENYGQNLHDLNTNIFLFELDISQYCMTITISVCIFIDYHTVYDSYTQLIITDNHK